MICQITSPTSVQIAAWIGCLFFLVAGWNQVETFLDRRSRRGAAREIQPQPLAVAKFDPPVAESAWRAREQEVANELVRLDQEINKLRAERREEVGELQQKINKVDREVGELRASMQLNHQQLVRIDAKLDRMIERQG
jgi:DNA repair exonuclease SbcCD ATPase subunit